MTPHEESTIKERIKDIAAVVRDLTCMIDTPEGFNQDAKEWWQQKLEIYHKRMQDIVNDQ